MDQAGRVSAKSRRIAAIERMLAFGEVDCQLKRRFAEKVAQIFLTEKLTGDRAGFIGDHSIFTVLTDAVELLGPRQAIEFLIESDWPQLQRRIRAADQLSFWLAPLCTVQELARQLAAFAIQLGEDRQHVLQTGLGSRRYPECRWLEVMLGHLYPTRCASGTIHIGVHSRNLYRWYRLEQIPGSAEAAIRDWLVQGQDEPNSFEGELVLVDQVVRKTVTRNLPKSTVSATKTYRRVAYRKVEVNSSKAASIRPQLEPEVAAKIEGDRSRLLDLKIAVLGELAACMEEHDTNRFWSRAFRPFAEKLHDKDFAFYLRLDGQTASSKIEDAVDRARWAFNRGIATQLGVIGHCYAELTAGRFSHAAEGLQKDNLLPGPYLQHVAGGMASAPPRIKKETKRQPNSKKQGQKKVVPTAKGKPPGLPLCACRHCGQILIVDLEQHRILSARSDTAGPPCPHLVAVALDVATSTNVYGKEVDGVVTFEWIAPPLANGGMVRVLGDEEAAVAPMIVQTMESADDSWLDLQVFREAHPSRFLAIGAVQCQGAISVTAVFSGDRKEFLKYFKEEFPGELDFGDK